MKSRPAARWQRVVCGGRSSETPFQVGNYRSFCGVREVMGNGAGCFEEGDVSKGSAAEIAIG